MHGIEPPVDRIGLNSPIVVFFERHHTVGCRLCSKTLILPADISFSYSVSHVSDLQRPSVSIRGDDSNVKPAHP